MDARHNGRGLASRATAEMVSIAFAELGLHRVQAGTQPDNLAYQRVLIKNSLRQYGYAPEYLKLACEWRDELLFQRLATDGVDDPPRRDCGFNGTSLSPAAVTVHRTITERRC